MKSLPLAVLDASAALALVLAEEEGSEVAALLSEVVEGNGQVYVPALFWYELGNGILSAERAGRARSSTADRVGELFGRLPLVTDGVPEQAARSRTLALARKHALGYYDAAYLELALRLECRLKSFDSHLLALKKRYSLIQ